ncbi:unnamed protein product [Moneuplotes crassus]|uniref:EF-hand domain-containing protein n=1 Tax=Euplotes crassus TaxID=5936 RepID=A0AAD1UEH9_EUPCR|nr:unnamed protein product [Moneuplotes crassus]
MKKTVTSRAPSSNLAVNAQKINILEGHKRKKHVFTNHSNLIIYDKGFVDGQSQPEIADRHRRRFSMNYRNASQISTRRGSKNRFLNKRPQRIAEESFEKKYFLYKSVLKYKKNSNSISLTDNINNSTLKVEEKTREPRVFKQPSKSQLGRSKGYPNNKVLRNTITTNGKSRFDSINRKFNNLKETQSMTNEDSNIADTKIENKAEEITTRNKTSTLSTRNSIKKIDNNLRIIKDMGYHAFEGIRIKESPVSKEIQEEKNLKRKKQIFEKLCQTRKNKSVLRNFHDEYVQCLGAMKLCANDLEMNLNTLTQPEVKFEIDSQPDSPGKIDNDGSYVNYGFTEELPDQEREQTNVKSLEGIRAILESELQDILDCKKKEYTIEDTKNDFCDYGKVFKKLIRIILNVKNNGGNSLKMDWKERALFAMNLDHLWRSILFAQDRIFTENDQALKNKLAEMEKYEDKYLLLQKKLDDKNKQTKQIQNDFLKQINDLNKKFENLKKDKHLMTIIAEDRSFELNCIRNDVDIIALKTYYRDLDDNMLQAWNEKKPQMETCQKLLNIINRILKQKEKERKGVDLSKFRMWRKNRKKKASSEEPEFEEDIILQGKKKEEPRAVDELLEYLYTNYTELFVINGEEKDRIMLEKEEVFRVLDEIPETLIKKLLVPPPKDAQTIEIQTDMTMPPADLGKAEFVNSFNDAYGEKDGKKKVKGPKNNLLKTIGRFMINNKKDKVQPMIESNALKMVSGLLSDKLKNDIDSENSNKKIKLLPNYALDQLSMKFGLKTIAVKNLISLKDGLAASSKVYQKDNPGKMAYSQLLSSILGFEGSPEISYSQEQVNLIIKAKPLWNEAQEHCKKTIKIRKDSAFSKLSFADFQVGGNCSLLEVIDVFTNWCNKDKELLASFIPKLTPDIPEEIKDNQKAIDQFYIDFSLVKICHKAAKLGKTIKYIHQTLDKDGDGTLDADEILNGLRDKFNIFFGEEEAKNLHILFEEETKNKAGEKARIHYLWNNYSETYYDLYRITELRFIELLLQEWDDHILRTNEKLMKIFVEFDDNGDQVLSFEEFEQLINHLEKSMSRDRISELFNETLEMDENSEDLDKMNPDCFCEMALSYKLGGYGKCFIPNPPMGKKNKL